MKKVISTLLILLINFSVIIAQNKPITYFVKKDGVSLWGYKTSYSAKDWLFQPILEHAGDFGKNNYAIIKKDGAYNLVDLNMNLILPEWSSTKPEVIEGFIVAQSGKTCKLYDMEGKQLYSNTTIAPVCVELYRHTDSSDDATKTYKRKLIGFSIGGGTLTYKSYKLLYPDLTTTSKLTSYLPIRSAGGLVLFVDKTNARNTPLHGVVTDAEGNIVDEIDGQPQLARIMKWENKPSKYQQLEQDYKGVIPAFLVGTDDVYKAKGWARVAGVQFIEGKSLKYYHEAEEKWHGAAYKMAQKPEIIESYNRLVIAPLYRQLDKNSKSVAYHKTQPVAKKVSLSENEGVYFFTTDGKTPLSTNPTMYRNVEPIKFTENYICHTETGAEVINKNGIKLITDSSTDFEDFGNNFIKGADNKGNYRLYTGNGTMVGGDSYQDIILSETTFGDVFYFVTNGGQWKAWAPGHAETEPRMRAYDYVSQPDKDGNVDIVFNGYTGTYNLANSTTVSPEKALFNKAYYGEGKLSDAKRIGIYREVIALDKLTREGYTGAALCNIGAIYEDAGDEDTAFQYYEQSKDAGNDMGEKNWKRIRNNRRLERFSAVANAIAGVTSSFVSGMSGVTGTMPTTQYTGYAEGYGSLTDNDNTGSGYSSSYYQNQYDNWERRAQSAYNSLTNLGSRYKENGREKSGSTHQSMSSSNYVQQKKSLRTAQSEMKSIRQKARRDGVTINQSHWETVSVSY